jgi:septal ring factor EnvC (AmiA/AmiB activator)
VGVCDDFSCAALSRARKEAGFLRVLGFTTNDWGAMFKRACLLLCLCGLSKTMYGEPADPCAQMAGSALGQCRNDQQALRQQLLERQLTQQEQRQNQLDQQQRDVQQQLESLRLQNEDLRKQLRETAGHLVQPAAADNPKSVEVQKWTAENRWFGSDYPRTEFAMRYAKQLAKEKPDLTRQALLDAVSTKVNETFGEKH